MPSQFQSWRRLFPPRLKIIFVTQCVIMIIAYKFLSLHTCVQEICGI